MPHQKLTSGDFEISPKPAKKNMPPINMLYLDDTGQQKFNEVKNLIDDNRANTSPKSLTTDRKSRRIIREKVKRGNYFLKTG